MQQLACLFDQINLICFPNVHNFPIIDQNIQLCNNIKSGLNIQLCESIKVIKWKDQSVRPISPSFLFVYYLSVQ